MGRDTQVRKRALIVKLGQIGDVVMAIPAARALYERGFDIHWLCGRAVYPLMKTYSWIHAIPVDDRAILKGHPLARAQGCFRLWRIVAFQHYDLCATLYYDRRFRMLTLPIMAKKKIGLSQNNRERMLIPGRHHTDEFVRLLLGMEDSCRPYSTPPVPPDRPAPSPLPAKSRERRIVLVPGGTSNVLGEQVLRRWPIGHYVSVTKQLLARGWEVVLLGGPEDTWVKPHFASLDVTDSIARFTLPEVVSLCDASDAVVTHDTGPLHLAGLSKACVIGIFGPTDPATRIPRRPLTMGIWGGEGFACRPCYDGRDFAPCRFNGCLHEVTPERIIRELDRLLGGEGVAPTPAVMDFPASF